MLAFSNIEYTLELSEALSRKVELMLMIPEKQAQRFGNVIHPEVKLKPFKRSRMRYPVNLLQMWRIVKEIERFSPDVIHIQRGDPWFNIFLPYLRKYPLVTTIHDVELHIGDEESKKISVFTHKLAIRLADQIIVHGQKLKEQMLERVAKPPEDINVIYRGINSIYTRYIKDEIEEDEGNILFFGRIWEYKGLQYLIEAEPLITEAVPNAKIVIAGRGEDMSRYLKMMVNKDRFVVYNDYISNETVARLFQEASIVALPYIEASQSGVLPLAYAFRKPVVVTEVGSLPEVVDHGETGYVVPPRDSVKLAEAIIDLLRDREKRMAMGEKAFEKAIGDLSWDSIAENTVNIYRKALSNGKEKFA